MGNCSAPGGGGGGGEDYKFLMVLKQPILHSSFLHFNNVTK